MDYIREIDDRRCHLSEREKEILSKKLSSRVIERERVREKGKKKGP